MNNRQASGLSSKCSSCFFVPKLSTTTCAGTVHKRLQIELEWTHVWVCKSSKASPSLSFWSWACSGSLSVNWSQVDLRTRYVAWLSDSLSTTVWERGKGGVFLLAVCCSDHADLQVLGFGELVTTTPANLEQCVCQSLPWRVVCTLESSWLLDTLHIEFTVVQ